MRPLLGQTTFLVPCFFFSLSRFSLDFAGHHTSKYIYIYSMGMYQVSYTKVYELYTRTSTYYKYHTCQMCVCAFWCVMVHICVGIVSLYLALQAVPFSFRCAFFLFVLVSLTPRYLKTPRFFVFFFSTIADVVDHTAPVCLL